MITERILFFLTGFLLGSGDVVSGAITTIAVILIHFLEYEFQYRLQQAIVGEEVVEHK